MTPSNLDQQLADGLASMQLELPADTRSKLLAYLDLLAQWNRTFNLTAVRDPAQMVSRHLLDSLAVLPWVRGTRLADLGSGAGLPGIALALARPELAVTLVERNGKKARFLREVARSLPLANVTVAEVDVQNLTGSFDTITTRAFASLADMLTWAGHLLAPGGRWLALKGRVAPTETAGVPACGFRILAIHPLTVPGSTGVRCVVELVQAASANPDPTLLR